MGLVLRSDRNTEHAKPLHCGEGVLVCTAPAQLEVAETEHFQHVRTRVRSTPSLVLLPVAQQLQGWIRIHVLDADRASGRTAVLQQAERRTQHILSLGFLFIASAVTRGDTLRVGDNLELCKFRVGSNTPRGQQ